MHQNHIRKHAYRNESEMQNLLREPATGSKTQKPETVKKHAFSKVV